jgi:hypothetical protein
VNQYWFWGIFAAGNLLIPTSAYSTVEPEVTRLLKNVYHFQSASRKPVY